MQQASRRTILVSTLILVGHVQTLDVAASPSDDIADADHEASMIAARSNTNPLSDASALELTVRKLDDDHNVERFVAEVYALPVDAASPSFQDTKAQYVGSFSYFAPEPKNTASRFVVPITDDLRQALQTAGDTTPLRIDIRLRPVGQHQRLEKSRLQLIDARIIP